MRRETRRPIWIWVHSVCCFDFNRKKKCKNNPDVPKNENGLIETIRMGKSICDKWVKFLSGSGVSSGGFLFQLILWLMFFPSTCLLFYICCRGRAVANVERTCSQTTLLKEGN